MFYRAYIDSQSDRSNHTSESIAVNAVVLQYQEVINMHAYAGVLYIRVYSMHTHPSDMGEKTPLRVSSYNSWAFLGLLIFVSILSLINSSK